MAAIPVGIRPGPVAAGAGSIWVGNLQDRNLTRIDPEAAVGRRGRVARRPDADGLAVGAGAVWVAHGLGGELSRVEPQFGRVTQTITVTRRSTAGSAAVGAGYVWAAYGDSTLARIQPAAAARDGVDLHGRHRRSRRSSVARPCGSPTRARRPCSASIRSPSKRARSGRSPSAAGPRRSHTVREPLWVANSGDDTVTRIDPSTDATVDIRVGDEPAGDRRGCRRRSGSRTRATARCHGSTPRRTTSYETIEVGNAPAGIAVVGGFVWVAVQAP